MVNLFVKGASQMLNLDTFIAAFKLHEWPLFAALIVGGLVALSKQGWFSTWLAAKLTPQSMQWYALLVSCLTVGSGDIVAGKSLGQAALDVVTAVGLAIVGHQVVIENFRKGVEWVPKTAKWAAKKAQDYALRRMVAAMNADAVNIEDTKP
jgi:hypothetical protein